MTIYCSIEFVCTENAVTYLYMLYSQYKSSRGPLVF